MHRLYHAINLIRDEDLRKFVEEALKRAPKYAWTSPSSASGRYHPPDERCAGGQVLHVRRVVHVCLVLASVHDVNAYDFDTLIAAALLHDIVKYGTDDEPAPKMWRLHDVGARVFLDPLRGMIDNERWNAVFVVIEGHMGRWASSPTLSPQQGTLGYLLHVADAIAADERSTIDVR